MKPVFYIALCGLVLLGIEPALAMAPLRMKVAPTDQLEIKGYRGDVEYIVDPTSSDIQVSVDRVDSAAATGRVEIDEWQFTMRREKNRVLLVVESPQSKEFWAKILTNFSKQPKFNLKVRAPALNTKLNWHEGKFFTKNFDNGLHLNIVKGDVQVLSGKGELRIDTQSGPIKILNWNGNADIETFESNIDVSGVEGDLRVDNFVGKSRVTGVTGFLRLASYKGDTRASQLKGKVEFKNGNSPLHIDNLEGELRGKTMQGAVFATVKGEVNIRVESNEGQINLRLPGSGAWVNLGTEAGSLLVPTFLKLTRLASQQIRSGKLRGTSSGSVFVRTTSGDIHIR